MQAIARTNGVRISTRKVRLVADAIRNMQAMQAMQVLEATQKRASTMMLKTLKSAVANALQKGANEATLKIIRIEVDGAPTLRRMHIGSRSHVRMYTKRSSNVRVIVDDMSPKGTTLAEAATVEKAAEKMITAAAKAPKEEKPGKKANKKEDKK